MKIQSIELKGYRRLLLKNIRSITLTMTEVVQIILGTNGSGKSSLMWELTPLPPNPQAYSKQGSKRIVVSQGADTYELFTSFSPVMCTFIKNGIEDLNPGQTMAVQKDMVRKIFGVTPATHSLVIGEDSFTSMGPGARREWFTTLCDVDYRYAISVYNKVKEAARDSSGALKIAKKRLLAETSESIDKEEYQTIRSRLEALTKESQALYQKKNNNALTTREATDKAQSISEEIISLGKQFFSIKRILDQDTMWSPAEIMDQMEYTRTEAAELEGKYCLLSEQYEMLSGKVANSAYLDDGEVNALKSQAVALNEKKSVLTQAIKLPLDGLTASSASIALAECYESLLAIFTSLPNNMANVFTKEAVQKLSDEQALLCVQLNSGKDKINKLEHELHHYAQMHKSATTECPECKHEWKVGYNVSGHEAVKQSVQKGRVWIEGIKAKLSSVEESLSEQRVYWSLLDSYRDHTRFNSALAPLWNYLSSEGLPNNGPAQAMTYLDMLRLDMPKHLEIESLSEQIKAITERIDRADASVQRDAKQNSLALEALEQQIGFITSSQRLLKATLAEQQQYHRRVTQVGDILERSRALSVSLDKAVLGAAKSLSNELIDFALVETHQEIAELSTRVNRASVQLGVVEDLKRQVIELELDEAALKMLHQSLSPTDGLIAEGLLGFIKRFVSKMNAVIRKIWTYRLEVQDCSVEGDSADLNYKFPLLVNDPDNVAVDVSKGSSGMREVVNLAFKITAMSHLGMGDHPLILDEFGITFDEAHRESATETIKALMDQMSFSQLYVVSHYHSNYGAFANAEVCVMDKTNITLSSTLKYNEHVCIEA